MSGRVIRLFGSFGSARLMASDGSRGGLPPIPIIDDTPTMLRKLGAEHQRITREEQGTGVILVRPDGLAGQTDASPVVDAIGKLFSYNLRPYDSLCRFGDDMFLIVIPFLKAEDLPIVMDRLRRVVSDRALYLDDGESIAVAASFGGAMLDCAISVEENLDRAGLALHNALDNGGNATRIWTVDRGNA